MTESPEFGKRTEHQAVVFDDKLWLMGGRNSSEDLNDVWCSDDGKKWNLVTNAAQWCKRNGCAVVILKNKFLLTGGSSSSSTGPDYLHDVWCSSDGKTWSQLTAKASWPRRIYSSFSMYSDQMWMMGGFSDLYNSLNDVWSSSNGTDWSQTNGKAEWPARYNHTSIIYDNKLWVIGGDTDGKYFSDVWYTEMPTGIKEQKNAVLMPNRSLSIETTPQNDLQIHFKVEETTPVRIGIYNSIGQEVAVICNDIRRFGEHTIAWNGSNSKGRTFSGGIYFLNFKTKKENVTHKVLFR